MNTTSINTKDLSRSRTLYSSPGNQISHYYNNVGLDPASHADRLALPLRHNACPGTLSSSYPHFCAVPRCQDRRAKWEAAHSERQGEHDYDPLVCPRPPIRVNPLISLGCAQCTTRSWLGSVQPSTMTHSSTVRAPSPDLLNSPTPPSPTARHIPPPPPGTQPHHLPRPVILDSVLRLSPNCKLLVNYKNGTGRRPWVICASNSASVDDPQWNIRLEALEKAGARIVQVPVLFSVLKGKHCSSIAWKILHETPCLVSKTSRVGAQAAHSRSLQFSKHSTLSVFAI
jgi:hypothetical protein